jgi:hypothetical protein
MNNTYKIQMYVKCTEEKAVSLREELAQITYDEFELDSVFDVSVDSSIPPETTSDNVMALCMVELEKGLHIKQIEKLLSLLPADKDYMPIEFHNNNTSAYGFIESEYYQIHDYKPDFIEEQINIILEDIRLESPDGIYMTPDGRQFYMGYFND